MDDPDWAKVLSYFYKEQETVFYLHELGESHELVEFTDIPAHELEVLLNDMHENELLEMDFPPTTVDTKEGKWETEGVEFSLAEKGFDVAHEREITKSQQETNRRSARLSGYLVVAIIIQSLIAVTQLEGGREVVIISLVILGLAFVVLIELNEDYIHSLTDKVRSLF